MALNQIFRDIAVNMNTVEPQQVEQRWLVYHSLFELVLEHGPYEILSIAQENKYLGKFSCFIMKLYIACTY